MPSSYPEAYRRALDLFTESVIKPDHELRTNAAYGKCYAEPMEVRQRCLAYSNTLKEIYHIECADEIDEIEVNKMFTTKKNRSRWLSLMTK